MIHNVDFIRDLLSVAVFLVCALVRRLLQLQKCPRLLAAMILPHTDEKGSIDMDVVEFGIGNPAPMAR